MDELSSKLLENVKNIAVVGLSPNGQKDSNIVARYLEEHGYNIIPVNPMYEEVLGKKAYDSLKDIPDSVDVDLVNIFRPANEVPEIVREALELKNISGIWIQEGIISEGGKALAKENGINVIMDRCIKKVHTAL